MGQPAAANCAARQRIGKPAFCRRRSRRRRPANRCWPRRIAPVNILASSPLFVISRRRYAVHLISSLLRLWCIVFPYSGPASISFHPLHCSIATADFKVSEAFRPSCAWEFFVIAENHSSLFVSRVKTLSLSLETWRLSIHRNDDLFPYLCSRFRHSREIRVIFARIQTRVHSDIPTRIFYHVRLRVPTICSASLPTRKRPFRNFHVCFLVFLIFVRIYFVR